MSFLKFPRIVSAVRDTLERGSDGQFRVIDYRSSQAEASSFLGKNRSVYTYLYKMDGGEVDNQSFHCFDHRIFMGFFLWAAESQKSSVDEAFNETLTASQRMAALSATKSDSSASESLLDLVDRVLTILTSSDVADFGAEFPGFERVVKIKGRGVPKTEFFAGIYESEYALYGAQIRMDLTIEEDRRGLEVLKHTSSQIAGTIQGENGNTLLGVEIGE